LCAIPAWIFGQENKSEQKDALKKELLAATGVKNIFEEFSSTLANNKLDSAMLWKSYSENPKFKQLNAKQQKAFKTHIDESSIRIADRYRELVKERGIFSTELKEQLFYSALDKLFTEDELKTLLAFYNLPDVKKFMSGSDDAKEMDSKEITDFLNKPEGKILGKKKMSDLAFEIVFRPSSCRCASAASRNWNVFSILSFSSPDLIQLNRSPARQSSSSRVAAYCIRLGRVKKSEPFCASSAGSKAATVPLDWPKRASIPRGASADKLFKNVSRPTES
jgi:hypothetical protein